jgi:hypothetical protein
VCCGLSTKLAYLRCLATSLQNLSLKNQAFASHPLVDLDDRKVGAVRSAGGNISKEEGAGDCGGDKRVATRARGPRSAKRASERLYENAKQNQARLEAKRASMQEAEMQEWRQQPARKLSPRIYPNNCLLGTSERPVVGSSTAQCRFGIGV